MLEIGELTARTEKMGDSGLTAHSDYKYFMIGDNNVQDWHRETLCGQGKVLDHFFGHICLRKKAWKRVRCREVSFSS